MTKTLVKGVSRTIKAGIGALARRIEKRLRKKDLFRVFDMADFGMLADYRHHQAVRAVCPLQLLPQQRARYMRRGAKSQDKQKTRKGGYKHEPRSKRPVS